MSRRVRLAPEQRRAQLIELGVEMLATRTLDELSVDDIAAQAGISRGLLFHYFRTKQDFRLAVTEAAAAELLARTEPDPGLPDGEQLPASLCAYVRYVGQNRNSYVSLVRGAVSADAAMQAVFERTRSAMVARITDQMAELGLPGGARAELAVRGWVAFCEECTIRVVIGDPSAPPAVDEDALVALLAAALPALVMAAVAPGAWELADLRSS